MTIPRETGYIQKAIHQKDVQSHSDPMTLTKGVNNVFFRNSTPESFFTPAQGICESSGKYHQKPICGGKFADIASTFQISKPNVLDQMCGFSKPLWHWLGK